MATDLVIVDARGLKCPLPVLKMEKQLSDLQAGSRLQVLATDGMAKIDIPLFCRQHGHDYHLAEQDGVLTFTITKAS